MVTGSVAEGVSDRYSDLDLTVYYDGELPDEEVLARIREQNGAPERAWLIGERAEGNIAEAYELNGIQVQTGHTTIAAWERDMAQVLEQLDVDTPLHKAMSGTLECIPIYGESRLAQWQARIAAYPNALARAMVEKHLNFFPIWTLQEHLAARDAVIWHYQILTEAAFNLLGLLAGLNRHYFTTFQFKKMRRFVSQLQIAPPRLADRLESLFLQDRANAIHELEALVGETIALIEQHIPDVDVSSVKKRLGKRRAAWAEPIFNL